MNIDPKIWGHSGWVFLHCITLGYPEAPTENDKQIYKDFLTNLGHVLPCEKCKINYQSHIKILSLNNEALLTRTNLVNWLVNIRNATLKEMGRPPISLQDIINDIYDIKTNREGKNDADNSFWNVPNIIVFVLILIILICLLVYKSSL